MEKITTAIIGGGASGLTLGVKLQHIGKTVLFERGERVGRKLSATGNGQGNVTNLDVTRTAYFSSAPQNSARAETIVRTFDNVDLTAFYASLGVLLTADERGRVYPAGRQASALTDALRFALQNSDVRLQTQVTDLEKKENGFILTVQTPEGSYRCFAENVVLCAGGKAAANFGTDGSAYALAKGLGHTCTPLYPSLVQLKTETAYIKTLKGIRVSGAGVAAYAGEMPIASLTGDVIFTDYGVSGDAIFRISAFVTDRLQREKISLILDFLPNVKEEEIRTALEKKYAAYPKLPAVEGLFGIVNNQLGRTIMRRASGDIKTAAKLVKRFPLTVTGSLGFEYAQVTKGGIPLSETDGNLQSRFVSGLYFAGEILDVDGPCGGYNLQWAYSSACVVAKAISAKAGGQVCV